MMKILIYLVFSAFVFHLGWKLGVEDAQNSPSYANCSKRTPKLRSNQEPCMVESESENEYENPSNLKVSPRSNLSSPPGCVNNIKSTLSLFQPLDTKEGARGNFDFDPSHGGRVGALTSKGRDTLILSANDNGYKNGAYSNAGQCTYIAQHYAHACFAVVFVSNLHGGSYGAGTGTGVGDGASVISQTLSIPIHTSNKNPAGLPVVRFDGNVDKDGIVIDGTNDNIVKREGHGTPEEQQSKGIGLFDLNHGHERPAGHFRRVPKEKGFQRVLDKLSPFIKNFNSINIELKKKLKWRGIKKGDDVVVMVVNEGETDLFLNFICSCKLHGINVKNIIVFAGSKEVVPIVEASEAIGIYHTAFAAVSKKASKDYLDRVFVDMMWYKAFSVYLVLHQGINILFQDVDLVWWRNPFPYFTSSNGTSLHTSLNRGKPTEAYFSDDGQRSKRFSPYFFNSGFYYLKSTKRSEYFTWSIMTAFDAVQVTGSHQNVFTQRLTESLGLGSAYTQILPPFQFPNGILYHHNKQFMDRLNKKKEDPYHFHMCWTQGKPQKLEYLRKANMWYLNEKCSPLNELIYPKGKIYQQIVSKDYGITRNVNTWMSEIGIKQEVESSLFIRNECCQTTGLSSREINVSNI
jgi:hypothetical protein